MSQETQHSHSQMIYLSSYLEFGVDLILMLPYAHYLFTRGLLGGTEGSLGSSYYYFFSRNHKETARKRDFRNKKMLADQRVPNTNEHVGALNLDQWMAPPLQNHYANSEFKYDVVVSNKYADEWDAPPVNYISPPVLDNLFGRLRGRRVFYNRLTDAAYADHLPLRHLADVDVCRKHQHVTTVQDMMAAHHLSYNLCQLLVYANCREFFSVQGGNSVLASYFGGRNTILIKRGQELKSGDFQYYHLFAGTKIVVARTDDQFLAAAG